MNVFILKAQYVKKTGNSRSTICLLNGLYEKRKDGYINQKGNQQFVRRKYFDKIDSIYAISGDLIYMLD